MKPILLFLLSISSLHTFSQSAKQPEQNCIKYKHMKIAGIACTSSGAGLFAAGITTLGFSLAGASGEHSVGGRSNNDGPTLAITGITLACVGFAALMTGLPLMGTAHIKRKKYCASQAYYELRPSERGIGMALSF